MQIQGQAALVTGGGSGLGEATARELALLGAKVAVLDLNEDNARRVAQDICGLAVRCDVPVVPIHIHGTDRVLPKGSSMPRPGRVVVNFGPPLTHGDLDARRFASRIEGTLELLADETTSDWYSARLAATRGESPGLRGPDIDSWRRDWLLERRRPAQQGAASPGGSAQRTWRDRARGNRPW